MIGAKVINLTLTITNKECNEDDQSFWQKLKEAVTDNTFLTYLFSLFTMYKWYQYVYSQVSCKRPPLVVVREQMYSRGNFRLQASRPSKYIKGTPKNVKHFGGTFETYTDLFNRDLKTWRNSPT